MTAPASTARAPAGAGIAFGVLTVAGSLLLWSVPDQRGPAGAWSEHLADAGDRTTMMLGALLMAAGVLALGWWLLGLATRLAGGASPEHRSAALAAGAVTGGLLLVAATTMFAVSGTVGVGGAEVPDGQVGLHLWYLGFWLQLLAVGVAGSGFVALTVVAGARVFPRWLRVAGWVAAGLQLTAAFAVVTGLALPLWVLLAGVAMLRPAPAPAPALPSAAATAPVRETPRVAG